MLCRRTPPRRRERCLRPASRPPTRWLRRRLPKPRLILLRLCRIAAHRQRLPSQPPRLWRRRRGPLTLLRCPARRAHWFRRQPRERRHRRRQLPAARCARRRASRRPTPFESRRLPSPAGWLRGARVAHPGGPQRCELPRGRCFQSENGVSIPRHSIVWDAAFADAEPVVTATYGILWGGLIPAAVMNSIDESMGRTPNEQIQ